MPKLFDEQKEYCDQPISESEILKSIKTLTNGKTPGSDGLPTNFYNIFWIDIKSLLRESILYAMNIGELSIEQKGGMIISLPIKIKIELF